MLPVGALLICGMCAILDFAYPGLRTPVLAAIAFIGTFLVSMAVLAGYHRIKSL